jgi:hypothetical protein
MRATRWLAGLFIGAALLLPGLRAQEKPKPAEERRSVTPLRVQIVLSEYEGEKKISSLPYILSVNADDRGGGRTASVRLGLRVPVGIGSKDSPSSIQYIDVGTDIDCRAETGEGGRFHLDGTVRRSSIYSSEPDKKPLDWTPGDPRPPATSSQPILRTFSASLNHFVRDGQTIQSTMATDPVSGRILKVEITLNVIK